MFSQSAQLYDLIYSSFKDYRAESELIAQRLHQERCRTVLDVACGTAEHARLLAREHGFTVDGIDLEPELVEIARAKHPDGRFYVADMAEFALPDRYDAVICMFSSIGYLKTLDRVIAALRCFAAHLEQYGIVLVEPWFAPGVMEDGRTATVAVDTDGVHVERTVRAELRERVSRLHFDYTIKDGSGVQRLSEVHDLGLFAVDEMIEAFAAAGLEATYDDDGPTGRGLYTARPLSRRPDRASAGRTAA